MKISLKHLILSGLCLAALSVLTGCNSTNTGAGTGSPSFYGPSTENTSDYTDNLRSHFRNNW